jgi:hypothetical protein
VKNSADKKYKYYLFDLGQIIKDRALNAKGDLANEQENTNGFMYESGRLMAFNEVISIMQQQADGFGIDLEELNLNDIDPDKDLT